jgi:hypothetical protein
MVDSDDLYGPMEVDDDLSTALDTETLADRDMVPLGFKNTPGSSVDTLPIEIFEHRRFLKVERSTALRSRQKVSKTEKEADKAKRRQARKPTRAAAVERISKSPKPPTTHCAPFKKYPEHLCIGRTDQEIIRLTSLITIRYPLAQ